MTVLPFVRGLVLAAVFVPGLAQGAQMTTPIPPGIIMPDEADTRIGTLRFHD